ncbi:MAG: DUF2071 domain-containing protein [Acidobacteria bacterium]|nr:DUF2071 domain-containing protein [Acidobacteriota bacterium]
MSTFLTAEWRKLIMAQYAIDPAILTPHLPPGLELDLYRDATRPNAQPLCFVSLVGFLFTRVRLKSIAIPFHTRFEEVNLRFYVKRTLQDGTSRRGVVFLSEIVPRPAITLVARALYGEAYSTARTRHIWSATPEPTPGTLTIRYDWRHRGHWQTLAVAASPTPQPIAPNSPEEFITEHYWGYTKRRAIFGRAPSTGEYGVAHPRWQTYPILSSTIHADFASLYGPAFATLSQCDPNHVLLAEGSKIAIKSGSHFTA